MIKSPLTARTLALTAAAFCALTGCDKKNGDSQAPPPPPSVSVSEVKVGDVIGSNTYIGQVVAYDDVNLTARVEGFLTSRNFNEGQAVKEGTTLFTIEKDQYLANLNAAAATVAQKKAEQIRCDQDYVRYKGLVKTSAVAQTKFEDAVAGKAVADANVLAAEADLQKAKLNLGYTDVKAPFDGVVGFVNYSVGNLVGPSSKFLANIVRVDQVKVDFSVSEIYLTTAFEKSLKNKTAPGTMYVPKLILSNGSAYPHPGKIAFWDNRINPSTGTLTVRAVFPNPEDLLVVGGYVKVKLESNVPEKCVLAPLSGIQEDQTGKFVLLVDKNNTVEKRSVKTGDRAGADIVIKHGLQSGDRIITEGLQKARAGAKVNPVSGKIDTPRPPPATVE
jgi:membrane fusion protein (multidrug efflux system)